MVSSNYSFFIIIRMYLHTIIYCFSYSYYIIIIFKQIYLTHRWNFNRDYHSESSGLGSNGKISDSTFSVTVIIIGKGIEFKTWMKLFAFQFMLIPPGKA